jgi:hypothetical protein
MGPGDFLDGDQPVTLCLGSNKGNECWVSNLPLQVKTPLFRSKFPRLRLLDYIINLGPLQGPVTIHPFESLLNFFLTVAGKMSMKRTSKFVSLHSVHGVRGQAN